MRAIIGGKIITENEILENHVLLFDRDIKEIIHKDNFQDKVYELIDAEGMYVSPGFIDLHIHGSGGCDIMDSSFEALEKISNVVAETGVTSFLATTMTKDISEIKKSLRNISLFKGMVSGAKVLGAHLEGPFISKKFKGAQDEKYILKPEVGIIDDYIDEIKIITLAPEVDEGNNFIKHYKNKGIVLSIGHSDAGYKETVRAIDDGVSYATHIFNAMKGLHHREPGVVGAIFQKRIFCELIPDCIHVNKDFLDTLIRIIGKEKIILITDCMRAGGMLEGVYELGGQEVFVDKNSARLSDGRLAGSVLKLNQGVKNVFENTSYSINEIVNMATINCARAIGVERKIGSIEAGKSADIILFDEGFNVKHTIINGKSVLR